MSDETEVRVGDDSTVKEGILEGFGFTIGHIVIGVAAFFVLFQIPLVQYLAVVLGGSVVFIGLAQLVYVIPLCISCRRSAEMAKMKGHIVWASLVLLLNGACWAAVGSPW